MQQYASGLVCLTGGEEGPLASALSSGGEEAGREAVEQLIRIFGRENVYVELQRHRNASRNGAIRPPSASQTLNLPVIATNGVRYAKPYDREVLDLFTAIRNHVELDQAGRLLALNSRRHLSAPAKWPRSSATFPEQSKTRSISPRALVSSLSDLGYEFPRYPVPDGETMDSFLRKRVAEGVLRRYGPKRDPALMQRAKKQVEHELALIEKLKFAGYFLIVWDIISSANNTTFSCRDEAAPLIPLFVTRSKSPLSIRSAWSCSLNDSSARAATNGRTSISISSEDKREQAIQYVFQRYGELGAAMSANVITYRGKSAARETGKALGFDEDTLGRLASLVGQWEWRGKDDTMAHCSSTPASTFSIHASPSTSNFPCESRTCPVTSASTRRHGHLPGPTE